MADLPWYKYYSTLFDADTALLSNQAVGGWQRLCNFMNPKNIETIEGDLHYFSRLLRCQEDEAMDILKELKQEEICTIIFGKSKKVTLTSRRIQKANNIRENNRIHKQRQRSRENVTQDVPPSVTGERLEVRGYIKKDNRKEEKKKEKKQVKKERNFILPDWVPKDAWNGYIEIRKSKKYPLTTYALNLLVNKLEAFKKDGYKLDALLNEASVRGWRSVFLVNPQPQDNAVKEKHDTVGLYIPGDERPLSETALHQAKVELFGENY